MSKSVTIWCGGGAAETWVTGVAGVLLAPRARVEVVFERAKVFVEGERKRRPILSLNELHEREGLPVAAPAEIGSSG